jgi:putative membrane protein
VQRSGNALMVYFKWLVRILIFVLLLGFAVKNLEPVTLSYFLGYEWREPLIIFLLIFLVFGVAIGLLAAMSTLFRQRREIQVLRRELRRLDKSEQEAQSKSPIADTATAGHLDVV